MAKSLYICYSGGKGRGRNFKLLLTAGLFIFATSYSFAQYYYGPPPPPKKPAPRNNQQPLQSNGLEEPSGFMSINFGLANPEGAFAQQIGSGYGGYALPGDLFSFSLGLPVNHSNFGVAVMVGSYANTYNNDQWVTNLNNNAAGVFYQNANPIQGTLNVYSNTSIMAGLYGTLPLGNLSIDGRLMIGGLIGGLPERAFGFYDTAFNFYEDDIQPSSPISFAVDAGIGLRYLIGNFGRHKVCLMVNADYFFSSVNYFTPDYLTVTQAGTYTPVQIQAQPLPGVTPAPDINGNISGTLQIALFSLTFGIGYQF
ncbi:MAG: hypothetical protein HKL88_07745 [Bacteroidia bacterium]|nr:hypothetical protein [Bacteroidia bacterium]